MGNIDPHPPYIGLKISQRIWTIHKIDPEWTKIRGISRIRGKFSSLIHIQHHNTFNFLTCTCNSSWANSIGAQVSLVRLGPGAIAARVSLHRSSQRLPFTPIQLHSCCILQSLYPLLEFRKRIETIANFPLAKFNRPQNGLGHALEWTARWDVLGMYTWLLTGSRKWRACALRALNFNGDVQSYDARSSKHFVIVLCWYF